MGENVVHQPRFLATARCVTCGHLRSSHLMGGACTGLARFHMRGDEATYGRHCTCLSFRSTDAARVESTLEGTGTTTPRATALASHLDRVLAESWLTPASRETLSSLACTLHYHAAQGREVTPEDDAEIRGLVSALSLPGAVLATYPGPLAEVRR